MNDTDTPTLVVRFSVWVILAFKGKMGIQQ